MTEAFADRGYRADGTLVLRSEPGALVTDADEVAARVVRLADEGVVASRRRDRGAGGRRVRVRALRHPGSRGARTHGPGSAGRARRGGRALRGLTDRRRGPDDGPNETARSSVMVGVGPIGRHGPSSEAGTRVDWQDVLETLVRDRGPALLRYGYLLTGDPTDAQELVQDALVSVLARKARMREPAAVEGYVRQTMLSSYIDGYRRRRRWLGLRHLVASPEADRRPPARRGCPARRRRRARGARAAGAGVRGAAVLRGPDRRGDRGPAPALRRHREAVPQRRGARARAACSVPSTPQHPPSPT